MSDRPRRCTRTTVRVPVQLVSEPLASGSKKRKATGDPEQDRLDFLLKNPKSGLTTIDISDIINAQTWDMLSPEHQQRLVVLMPPTALVSFRPGVEPHHPSHAMNGADMDVDEEIIERSPDLVNPSFFTEPHFQAAARTWQDHIFSGWTSDAAATKLREHEQGVRDGTAHAPWKDDTWETEHAAERAAKLAETRNTAGQASELKLTDLVQNGIIFVGDVIAYKRKFGAAGITVEKDVIVQSVNARTHAITVIVSPNTTKNLSPSRLLRNPRDPDQSDPAQSMEASSPTQLEHGILDVDGRLDKSKRPSGNAWKTCIVWRLRDNAGGMSSERGERDTVGTLYYLRESYHHDR